MTNQEKVDILKIVVVVGFTLSVLYHYVLVNYQGLIQYPYNTFLFNPADKFNDFFNIYKASISLNPYQSPLSVYFPFTFIIMYLFSFLKAQFALYVFLLLFVVFFIFYIYKNTNFLKGKDTFFLAFIFIFMSYPSLFLLDRGNVEGFVFIFLILFFLSYQQKNDAGSIIWLSFASAMKLYPLAFVALFFIDKKYKQLFLTLALTVSISILSAVVLDGGLIASYGGVKRNLALFAKGYFSSVNGLQHNSSLFGFFRLLQGFFPSTSFFVNSYNFLAIVIGGAMIIWMLFREHLLWKKVSLLVFIILLLPQVSFDYKLIHLFIPILLFVRAASAKFDMVYAILFGLLIIPKDYYVINVDISIAVIINPLLMISIMGIFVVQNYMETSRLGEKQLEVA